LPICGKKLADSVCQSHSHTSKKVFVRVFPKPARNRLSSGAESATVRADAWLAVDFPPLLAGFVRVLRASERGLVPAFCNRLRSRKGTGNSRRLSRLGSFRPAPGGAVPICPGEQRRGA